MYLWIHECISVAENWLDDFLNVSAARMEQVFRIKLGRQSLRQCLLKTSLLIRCVFSGPMKDKGAEVCFCSKVCCGVWRRRRTRLMSVRARVPTRRFEARLVCCGKFDGVHSSVAAASGSAGQAPSRSAPPLDTHPFTRTRARRE